MNVFNPRAPVVFQAMNLGSDIFDYQTLINKHRREVAIVEQPAIIENILPLLQSHNIVCQELLVFVFPSTLTKNVI